MLTSRGRQLDERSLRTRWWICLNLLLTWHDKTHPTASQPRGKSRTRTTYKYLMHCVYSGSDCSLLQWGVKSCMGVCSSHRAYANKHIWQPIPTQPPLPPSSGAAVYRWPRSANEQPRFNYCGPYQFPKSLGLRGRTLPSNRSYNNTGAGDVLLGVGRGSKQEYHC